MSYEERCACGKVAHHKYWHPETSEYRFSCNPGQRCLSYSELRGALEQTKIKLQEREIEIKQLNRQLNRKERYEQEKQSKG